MDEVEINVRLILQKPGDQRSYDEIILLRNFISGMDFLKATFRDIHPRQFDELCRNLGVEIYETSDVIFEQGDAGDKFYVVLTGGCQIRVKNTIMDTGSGASEVREKVLYTCMPGQHFGERALEFNEPRAATVIAVTHSELLTVTKHAYVKVLAAYQDDENSGGQSEDVRANVIRALSKATDKRTEAELLLVASYLERRNEFFKKFPADQRLELCRVSELICIYGRTTLFKQGQMGQAFYVILSGGCEIYINKGNDQSESNRILITTLSMGASFGERALESENSLRTASVVTCDGLTELLVISREQYRDIVSVMMQTEMADKCALLRRTLLFKEIDFKHLREIAKYMEPKLYHIDELLTVSGAMARDIIFIREGECYVTVNVDETVDHKQRDDDETGTVLHSEQLVLGRVGPCAVLCSEITQLPSFNDEYYQEENIQATTIVSAYLIAKNDFFHHINSVTRSHMTRLIKTAKSPNLPTLWDAGPQHMGSKELKSQKIWADFKKDLMNGMHGASILRNLQKTKNLTVHIRCGDGGHGLKNIKKNTMDEDEIRMRNILNKAKLERSQRLKAEMMRKRERAIELERNELAQFKRQESGGSSNAPLSHFLGGKGGSAQRSERFTGEHEEEVKAVVLNSTLKLNNGITTGFPFSLVHIHRENIKYKQGTGPKRSVRCFVRICGVMTTCADALRVGESFIMNSFLKFLKGDEKRKEELVLNWQEFNGFECMPLHHSDHLVVYCRNAPVEVASLSPPIALLNHSFPAACRFSGQGYAVATIKSVTRTGDIFPRKLSESERVSRAGVRGLLNAVKQNDPPSKNSSTVLSEPSNPSSTNPTPGVLKRTSSIMNNNNATNSDDEESNDFTEFKEENRGIAKTCELISTPQFLKEISVVGEVHFAGSSVVEAFREAKLQFPNPLVNSFDGSVSHVCILPMYEWLVVSEEAFEIYDMVNLCEKTVEEKLQICKNDSLDCIAEAFIEAGLPVPNKEGNGCKENDTQSSSISTKSTPGFIISDAKMLKILNTEAEIRLFHREVTESTLSSIHPVETMGSAPNSELLSVAMGQTAGLITDNVVSSLGNHTLTKGGYLPQISVYQARQSLNKQRKKEAQESEAAFALESSMRIYDRMNALKETTETRAKVLSMHNQLCTTEKKLHLKLLGKVKSRKLKKLTKQEDSDDEGDNSESPNEVDYSVEPTDDETSFGSIPTLPTADNNSGSYVLRGPSEVLNPMDMVNEEVTLGDDMQSLDSSSLLDASMGSSEVYDIAAAGKGFDGDLYEKIKAPPVHRVKKIQKAQTELEERIMGNYKRKVDEAKRKVGQKRLELLEGLNKMKSLKSIEGDIKSNRLSKPSSTKETVAVTTQTATLPMRGSNQGPVLHHKVKPKLAAASSAQSLSLKLDVLETVLNQKNGIATFHPSVPEEFAFVEKQLATLNTYNAL